MARQPYETDVEIIQKTWLLENIARDVEICWEQRVTELNTVFKCKKLDSYSEIPWSLYDQKKLDEMKRNDEMEYKMLATNDVARLLDFSFKNGDQTIDDELGELQEILRTTWHLIRQTEEQCNDHDDVVDEEQSTRMRGGGGDDDLPDAEMDAQLYKKMAHSYDSSKKRKYSHSVSGLPAFLSRPEAEPENSQSSGSRPSNRLQIPDVSDNVPHQVGKSEGESTTDDDDYIQDETLQCERSEIKWLETDLNVYHSIFIIKRMTGLYREFLLQSRGVIGEHFDNAFFNSINDKVIQLKSQVSEIKYPDEPVGSGVPLIKKATEEITIFLDKWISFVNLESRTRDIAGIQPRETSGRHQGTEEECYRSINLLATDFHKLLQQLLQVNDELYGIQQTMSVRGETAGKMDEHKLRYRGYL